MSTRRGFLASCLSLAVAPLKRLIPSWMDDPTCDPTCGGWPVPEFFEDMITDTPLVSGEVYWVNEVPFSNDWPVAWHHDPKERIGGVKYNGLDKDGNVIWTVVQ